MVAARAMVTDVPMGIALATVSVAQTETVRPKVEDNHRAMANVVRRVIAPVTASVDGKGTALAMVSVGQKRIVRVTANVVPNRVQRAVRRVAKRKTNRATRLDKRQTAGISRLVPE